jgi:hypothetical protein
VFFPKYLSFEQFTVKITSIDARTGLRTTKVLEHELYDRLLLEEGDEISVEEPFENLAVQED